MLFGNMLTPDKGIFTPISERSSSSKQLSTYMSNLLANKDNLLKAAAEELLRTDLLHMTTKEKKHTQGIFTELLYYDSLSYWFTANLSAHKMGSHESDQEIKSPLYTPRPHNWQREGLPCGRHDVFCF